MTFDDFYNALIKYPSLNSVFSFYDVLVNFILPCLLVSLIAVVYKQTHRGVTYNQSFVHTMFLMAVTTSIIMMIIGSNIARAFSLVGALSIIRFRTAIKDSRDIGYIFVSIAIGMACGTGMYMVSIMFSVMATVLLFILHYSKTGEKVFSDKLLKLKISESKSEDGSLDKTLAKFTDSYTLVHSENTNEPNTQLYTFIFTSKGTETDNKLLGEIRTLNENQQASIYYNDQRVEL